METVNDFGLRCEALIDRLAPWQWNKTPTDPPYRGLVARTIGWVAWLGADDVPVLPDAMTEGAGAYTGYIGAINDEGREVAVLEEMPEFLDIEAVLGRVRERTAHARVRPSWDPVNTYFVGSLDHNPGLPVLEVPRT